VALRSIAEERVYNDIHTPLHEKLLGNDPRMVELRQLIDQLAKTTLAVLITGETGTGKDIVAKLLHQLSPRRNQPFIKINCPSIPEGLFESELLGYERGAFTGASGARPGRFELAREGTLFLDEIAEIPPFMQTKLLHILDGEPYMRVGGTKPMEAKARIVAATNIPLEEAMEQGRLRKDVAFRLGETILHLPPLRERRGDIPLLAAHFYYNMCALFKKPYIPMNENLMERLQARDWPGNVRELAARIKEYAATGSEDALLAAAPVEDGSESGPVVVPDISGPETVQAPPAERKFPPLKVAAKQAAEAAERALIEETLRYTLWNRRKAAKLLKTSYSSLLRRIEMYNIGKM